MAMDVEKDLCEKRKRRNEKQITDITITITTKVPVIITHHHPVRVVPRNCVDQLSTAFISLSCLDSGALFSCFLGRVRCTTAASQSASRPVMKLTRHKKGIRSQPRPVAAAHVPRIRALGLDSGKSDKRGAQEAKVESSRQEDKPRHVMRERERQLQKRKEK